MTPNNFVKFTKSALGLTISVIATTAAMVYVLRSGLETLKVTQVESGDVFLVSALTGFLLIGIKFILSYAINALEAKNELLVISKAKEKREEMAEAGFWLGLCLSLTGYVGVATLFSLPYLHAQYSNWIFLSAAVSFAFSLLGIVKAGVYTRKRVRMLKAGVGSSCPLCGWFGGTLSYSLDDSLVCSQDHFRSATLAEKNQHG